MSYLISQLKNDLEPKFHDTSLNKLSGNIYDKIFEAARNVLNDMDPQETMRVSNIDNALYDQVYSYVCPTDLKDKKIIAIRPQVNSNASNNFTQTGIEEFDQRKDNNSLAFEYDDGIKTIKLSKALTAGATINDCESTTANGTWAAGGQAASLETDNFNYVTGGGSLRFNVTSGDTTGYIENSTMTSLDLTDYKNVGALFVWVYLPGTATNVILRWGSDSSNYYSSTVTTSSDSTAFKVGWNLLRFDWSGATTTGTPTDTAIDYIRVTITKASGTTLTACRVDSIVARLGSIYEIVYYSKYLFRTTAGTWIEAPTDDTDIINLDTTSYNVLLYEVAYNIAQELQGEDSSFDISFFANKKKEAWDNYKNNNKSQQQKPRNTYYRPYKR
jgi:hypothetical protein